MGSSAREFLSRSSSRRGPSCSIRATLPALAGDPPSRAPPRTPTGGLRLHSQKSPGFADQRGRAQPSTAGCFIAYLRKVRALTCWRALVVTSLIAGASASMIGCDGQVGDSSARGSTEVGTGPTGQTGGTDATTTATGATTGGATTTSTVAGAGGSSGTSTTGGGSQPLEEIAFACDRSAKPPTDSLRRLTMTQLRNTIADLTRWSVGDAATASAIMQELDAALHTLPGDQREPTPRICTAATAG